MLTHCQLVMPQEPLFTGDPKQDQKALLQHIRDVKRTLVAFVSQLNSPHMIAIGSASVDASPIGSKYRSTGAFESVTVQANTETAANLDMKWGQVPRGAANTSGQSLAGINAYGYDGAATQVAATINARSTETWSASARGSRWQFRVTPAGSTTLAEYGSLDSRGWRSEAAYVLKDGITAPTTLAGYGQIYIDSADGDLKIKYGDGTVKTIVVDT